MTASIYKDAPNGVLRLYIDLRIDCKEMSTWESWRIAAFFNGVAKMLRATRDADYVEFPSDPYAAAGISEADKLAARGEARESA